MKNAHKRLTSTFFMERYRRFLVDGGVIHLKTDSNFLFTYTKYVVEKNELPVDVCTDDLYHATPAELVGTPLMGIQTYYESMWIARGLNIRYLRFHLPHTGELAEPEVEIPLDEYRSYSRNKRSSLETAK
jgi:tRNA (guanine-N7-)-methyltransferase